MPLAEMESVIDKRIRLLRDQANSLKSLMDNSEPGLMTWLYMVVDVVTEINAIMDGERD